LRKLSGDLLIIVKRVEDLMGSPVGQVCKRDEFYTQIIDDFVPYPSSERIYTKNNILLFCLTAASIASYPPHSASGDDTIGSVSNFQVSLRNKKIGIARSQGPIVSLNVENEAFVCGRMALFDHERRSGFRAGRVGVADFGPSMSK